MAFKKYDSSYKRTESPFTRKIDPVKKPVGPVTPSTRAEYMQREVWNVVQRNEDKKKKKKKPVDDDTDVMTPEQEARHRAEVLEYNRTKAKPMTERTKNKIKQQLSKMDKNDPEAKLLQDMLNLPKNK